MEESGRKLTFWVQFATDACIVFLQGCVYVLVHVPHHHHVVQFLVMFLLVGTDWFQFQPCMHAQALAEHVILLAQVQQVRLWIPWPQPLPNLLTPSLPSCFILVNLQFYSADMVDCVYLGKSYRAFLLICCASAFIHMQGCKSSGMC